ncbi:MAG: ion channel [Desulfovermiculus sp.]
MDKPLSFTAAFLSFFTKILFLTTPIWGMIFLGIIGLACLFSVAEDIDFSHALYFAGVTAMTIGYGDIFPETVLGKIIALLIGVLGLLITGIVVAVALQAIKITYTQIIAEGREMVMGSDKRITSGKGGD